MPNECEAEGLCAGSCNRKWQCPEIATAFFKSLAMTKLVLQYLNCHCEGAKRLSPRGGSLAFGNSPSGNLKAVLPRMQLPGDCHGFFQKPRNDAGGGAGMKPPALCATEGELAGGQEKPLWSALREGGQGCGAKTPGFSTGTRVLLTLQTIPC